MSIIFWAIVLYILYKLVFGFVIPVVTATNAMSARMKNMREQQGSVVSEEHQRQRASQNSASAMQPKTTQPNGDYIEFEEIK